MAGWVNIYGVMIKDNLKYEEIWIVSGAIICGPILTKTAFDKALTVGQSQGIYGPAPSKYSVFFVLSHTIRDLGPTGLDPPRSARLESLHQGPAQVITVVKFFSIFQL